MQVNTTERNCAQGYEEGFAWRKTRQIANLAELSRIAPSSDPDPEVLPGLFGTLVSDDPKDALRHSILLLWLEAIGCYVFGEFQACILTCGAVVERCLKLEYETAREKLPEGRWTLGKCIYKLDWQGIIAPEILDLAKQIVDPRNSRAHALLEHSDPQLAIIGGPERGIDVLSSHHYLIEPYRGEAKKIIEITSKILSKLYGVESPQSPG